MSAYAQARLEAEARAGIDPLDDLLYERSQIVAKLAPLRALYGPGGMADHNRKIELSRVRALRRAEFTRAGTRITEDRLDEEAHTHPDYVALIAAMTTEKARHVKMEGELEALDFRIYRGQALLRYIASEPK